MQGPDWFSSWYQSWVDNECRKIDFVASWTTLVSCYDQLSFIDSLDDAMRMEEFKWIVHEMNKFLTRTRNALLKCEDWTDAVDWLGNHLDSTDAVSDRKSLAYQMLRQRWILNARGSLLSTAESIEEEEDLGQGEGQWAD